MQKVVISLAIVVLCGTGLRAQQASSAPQTARQALMEMFFSKTPGTFVNHLPVATRTALEKSGAMAPRCETWWRPGILPTSGPTAKAMC